jgi:hypothetical protein
VTDSERQRDILEVLEWEPSVDATTVTSVLTLLYYLVRTGVFGSHDRE